MEGRPSGAVPNGAGKVRRDPAQTTKGRSMTAARHRRVHRSGAYVVKLAQLLSLVLGAAAGYYALAAVNTAPGWVPVLVGLLFAALFVLVFWCVLAPATIVDDERLRMRHAFSSRSFLWREIQAIDLEPNPAAASGGNEPTVMAVMYDAGGNRMELPFVDDRHTRDVLRELADLRAAWQQGRGDDWQQLPTTRAGVERHQQRPSPAFVDASVIALMLAFLVFCPAFVVWAVLFMTESYAVPGEQKSFIVDRLLGPIPLLIGTPLATYLITLVVLLRRRRPSDQESATHSS